MRLKQLFCWCALSAATMAPDLAFAHHSFAMFDVAKDATLAGTVREFQWQNPHCFIQLMVPNASGNLVEWSIELTGGPGGMRRRGWKATSLQPGDKISVKMHPMRDGSPGGSLMSVTLADGKTLE